MRRAPLAIAFVALAASIYASIAASRGAPVARIDGIGLVDYASRPTFKVGDYVRYRISGTSEMGSSEDYTLTLVVAGQEIFWGDSCFWLESWTDLSGTPGMTAATLMSYSIFDDSLYEQHLEAYRRKSIEGVDDQGRLLEKPLVLARNATLKRTMFASPIMRDTDTLGVDTVQTPLGVLKATKVSLRRGQGQEASQGDSSSWNEERENRTRWYSPRIPITHIAYEEIEKLVTRRSWMIGRSSDASPTVVRDHGHATARLLEAGHGFKGRAVPESRQLSFAQIAAAERAGAARPRATPSRGGR